MNLLRTIAAEAWGLFVDDGPFAAAILIWVLLCWAILPRLGVFLPWAPFILFAGLAAILVLSATRRARA